MRGSAEDNLQIVSKKKIQRGTKKYSNGWVKDPPSRCFFWGGGYQEGLLTPRGGMEGNGGGRERGGLLRAVNEVDAAQFTRWTLVQRG
jgi:hypothetical protein